MRLPHRRIGRRRAGAAASAPGTGTKDRRSCRSPFRLSRRLPSSYHLRVISPASSRFPSPKANPAARAIAPRIRIKADVTISSATPTCCSAMKMAITMTADFASLARIGTPATCPAEATIKPRTNSPTMMPSTTITMPAINVGINDNIIPNISLILSRPSAALARRMTTSITSQNMSLPTAWTGSM